MSHLIFSIFSINFCSIKSDMSSNTFRPQAASGFFDVECDFFCDFQTLCTSLPFFKKDNGSVKKLSVIHHSDISKSFPPTFIRLKKSYKLNYELFFLSVARCLKITEKVSFNIASEASYVHNLSGQKFMKNAENSHFGEFLKN